MTKDKTSGSTPIIPKKTVSTPSERKPFPHVPVYLCILLMFLAFMTGFFVSYKLFPNLLPAQNCIVSDQNASASVDVTLLYSDECKVCQRWNSVLDVFNDRAIPYSLKEVEISSPDGKALVAKFNVTEVPTALVGYEKMHAFTTTEKGISERFKRVLDKYVVKEINFNLDKYYPVMLLAPDCNSSDSNFSITLFDDPYQRNSLINSLFLRGALDSFGTAAKVDYVYVKTINDENYNAEMTAAAKYLYCAAQQGKYSTFEKLLIGKFCNFDDNAEDMTKQELIFCSSGGSPTKQNRKPLDLMELDDLAEEAGITGYSLDQCLDNEGAAIYDNWKSRIIDYGMAQRQKPIGVALVGCKFLVDDENLMTTACSMSNLSGCQ